MAQARVRDLLNPHLAATAMPSVDAVWLIGRWPDRYALAPSQPVDATGLVGLLQAVFGAGWETQLPSFTAEVSVKPHITNPEPRFGFPRFGYVSGPVDEAQRAAEETEAIFAGRAHWLHPKPRPVRTYKPRTLRRGA